MVIGFTGSQRGMTPRQKASLEIIVAQLDDEVEFHHGDCLGADEDAHNIVWEHSDIEIHLHPPIIDSKRAFCAGAVAAYEPKDYLARNLDIVSSCNLLIAAPKSLQEERRSGTWATIRYAREQNVPVIILDP